ncbi:protein-L-isoaspartate O-methyltransferase family protein [Spiribacter halobius]|uniref:Protein-L-isoaspartate O-methyltransferase n=1 Tax=Sediminicurvatus halobius TaxID=2182432 RepID=A0A2U2N728_9GAMM|nr:protein-L-isoaspartate O-methyltransferase [Spiribacter halobius]PWG64892.1 protein-L-isoaspartate O-methyltransferase [Spiribacter halobius]UEX78253.1 protein-L-isoaspartate O-methyltransferase [Spiribacter halobius]
MTDVDLAQARFNMVEQQVRTWEVLNERVLDVIETLPREDFVPAAYRNLAYADVQIPIAHGQVMMEPKVEGRLLQCLDPQPGERALEIGTGTGYLAACLARLAGQVTSVDLYPDFAELAGEHLASQGLRNVHLETGDAARGWEDGRRYDVIAVTGSLPELHEGFHRSLTIGGRLAVIVGTPPIMEALLITRIDDEQWATESLFDTSLPPLVGAPRQQRFEL